MMREQKTQPFQRGADVRVVRLLPAAQIVRGHHCTSTLCASSNSHTFPAFTTGIESAPSTRNRTRCMPTGAFTSKVTVDGSSGFTPCTTVFGLICVPSQITITVCDGRICGVASTVTVNVTFGVLFTLGETVIDGASTNPTSFVVHCGRSTRSTTSESEY